MRLLRSPTNCGTAGDARPVRLEIDWYAAESALRVRDSQEHFSLLSVRLEPEEGLYREP